MIFNIPQFIDKEDKIVGPLTAKQLGWLFGAGSILLVLWNVLDASAFYLSAAPIILIASALAFYRPYNQPLIKFIFSTLLFLFREKTYIWKRLPEKNMPIKKAPPKAAAVLNQDRRTNSEKISEISKLLDNTK
jgi:hypothetical protein